MIEVELACTLVCTVALVSYAIVQVAYSSIIHSASIIVYLCCYTVLVDVHITRKTVKAFSVSLASSLVYCLIVKPCALNQRIAIT